MCRVRWSRAGSSHFASSATPELESVDAGTSIAVGHPDVLDLDGAAQKIVAGEGVRAPVERVALGRPDALEIADRLGLGRLAGLGIRDDPQPVEVIVLGQHTAQLAALAGNDVD